MLPNSRTACGSHSAEEANEKECFNMPRSSKRGDGFCQDPSSQRKKLRIHIQTGVTTQKGESKRILPVDAAEKGEMMGT
jgi:hypothetical protein